MSRKHYREIFLVPCTLMKPISPFSPAMMPTHGSTKYNPAALDNPSRLQRRNEIVLAPGTTPALRVGDRTERQGGGQMDDLGE